MKEITINDITLKPISVFFNSEKTSYSIAGKIFKKYGNFDDDCNGVFDTDTLTLKR